MFKHRQLKQGLVPGLAVMQICSVWSREEPCREQGFLVLLLQPAAVTGGGALTAATDENSSHTASTGLSASGVWPAGAAGMKQREGREGVEVVMCPPPCLGAGTSKERVHGTSVAPAPYLHFLGSFLFSVVATAELGRNHT